MLMQSLQGQGSFKGLSWLYMQNFNLRGPSCPELPEILQVSWNLKLSWNFTHLARMSWKRLLMCN